MSLTAQFDIPIPTRITSTTAPRLHSTILGGVLVLSVLIPLYFSPFYPDYNTPKRALTETLVALLAVLWFFGMAIKGHLTFFRTPYYLPVAAFLGINLISLFQAQNISQGLDMMVQYTCILLVPILVIHIVHTTRHILILSATLAFTGGIVGLIGLLQYNGIASFYTQGTQPLSTIGNVTFVAEYYNVIFPIALSLIICFKNIYLRIAAVLNCLLIAGHLIVLGSRGGWLGFLVGLTVFAFVYLIKYPQLRQNLRRVVIALIFLLTLWSVLEDLFNADQIATTHWNRVLNRATDAITIKDDATRQRVHLWQDTLHLTTDHPFFGVGVGNFEYALPRYFSRESYAIKTRLEREHNAYWGKMLGRTEKQNLMAFRAHNDYLEIAAETGLPGLAIFLFLLYTIARAAYEQIRHHIAGKESLLVVGLASGLTATAVHALFSMNFQNPASSLSFFLAVGLLFAHQYKETPSAAPAALPASDRPPASDQSPIISIPIARAYRIIAAGSLILIATLAFEIQTMTGAFYYHIGVLLLKQGDYVQAQTALKRAVNFRQSHPFQTYQALGLAYFNTKRFPEAIQALQQSLSYFPDNVSALVPLAEIQEQSGRTREALDPLRHAETINPYAVDLPLKTARMLFKLTEMRAAGVELQQAQTLAAQDPDARYQVALTYLDCESPGPAHAILQALVTEAPQNADFRTTLALTLFRLGNLKAAQAECLQAIQLAPKQPRPYLLLGTLYEANNTPELAQQIYKQGLKMLPNDATLQQRVKRVEQ